MQYKEHTRFDYNHMLFKLCKLSKYSDNLFMCSKCRNIKFSMKMCKNSKYIIVNTIIKTLELLCLIHFKHHTSAPKIVWLKYNNSLGNKRISKDFNIFALNSEVSRIRPYSLRNALKYVYLLTKPNSESLVFKFAYKKYPNILFCADSDLSFLNKHEYIELKENSIVTAPHHGSTENEKAYDKITDGSKIGHDSLIFVRSDTPRQKKRPCIKYKNLKTKYCTVCNTSSVSQNVEFKIKRDMTFKVNKSRCKCK